MNLAATYNHLVGLHFNRASNDDAALGSTIGATDIIYFRDLKRLGLLPYTSNTSIKKFCLRYRIPVFGSARKYVFALQFFRACMEIRINDLQQVYGQSWAATLKLEMKQCEQYKDALEAAQLPIAPINNTQRMTTDSNAMKQKFLLDIKKALEL